MCRAQLVDLQLDDARDLDELYGKREIIRKQIFWTSDVGQISIMGTRPAGAWSQSFKLQSYRVSVGQSRYLKLKLEFSISLIN